MLSTISPNLKWSIEIVSFVQPTFQKPKDSVYYPKLQREASNPDIQDGESYSIEVLLPQKWLVRLYFRGHLNQDAI